jgi:hypothetical protein
MGVAAVDTDRTEVACRGGYRCEHCDYPEAASSTPLKVNHIIPEAKGGSTTINNLAKCCRSCNLHKHVKTDALDPVTSEMILLLNPCTLQWNEHFLLNRSTGEIYGSTLLGRASIEALVLNSGHAIATRRFLSRYGLSNTQAQRGPVGASKDAETQYRLILPMALLSLSTSSQKEGGSTALKRL